MESSIERMVWMAEVNISKGEFDGVEQPAVMSIRVARCV
jgi:hypothetical protein